VVATVTTPDPPDPTPQVVTEALRAAGHDVTVRELSSEPVGTGQMGESRRLHLTFAGDPGDAPATLVAKLPSGPRERRAAVAGTFRTEVGFYRRIAATVAVRAPRCWHAWISDDAVDFLLLLEDLAPAHQGDQILGCGAAEAVAAARNLAGLHGPRWCDPTLRDDGLEPPDPDSAGMLGDLLRPMTERFVERFADRLDPADRDVLTAVPQVAGEWLLGRLERFGPVHGDYRLDNLMFHPDGEVTALDWQTLSLGLPARDLAYLCSTSLDVQLRRSCEAEVVEAYHRALTDEASWGRGVTGYDLDACFDDYRYAMLQAPLIIVLGWAVGTPTERGDEMFLAMARRSAAAIRDHDPFPMIGR